MSYKEYKNYKLNKTKYDPDFSYKDFKNLKNTINPLPLRDKKIIELERRNNSMQKFNNALVKNIDDINISPYFITPENYNVFYNNLEKNPSSLLTAEEERFFIKWVKIHISYKHWYLPGVIFGCLQCFLFPMFIGLIMNFIGICHGFYSDPLLDAIGFLLLQSPLFSVTLPLSIAFGGFGVPFILRKIMFSKRYPYNDEIMKALGLGLESEIKNGASTFGGNIISKYLNK